jgi:hypothetical protein
MDGGDGWIPKVMLSMWVGGWVNGVRVWVNEWQDGNEFINGLRIQCMDGLRWWTHC